MARNKFGGYPLPGWLQSYMERHIGRPPVWSFPRIPDTPEGLSFEMMDFENRHHVLVYLEHFRSPQARGRIRNYWKRMEERYG